jgi:hypothetical protein
MGNIHTGVEQLQSLKRPAEEDNSQIGKATFYIQVWNSYNH